MLFARQRTFLALFEALGGVVSKNGALSAKDFQKLLFLYAQEWEDTPSYEFVPYRYGGFSFTSYADKRKLAATGFIQENPDESWELTDKGRAETAKTPALHARARRFAAAHADLRGDALLRKVYLQYSYYATQSKILEEVLPDADDRKKIAEARPPKQAPGLVTIGYEGRSLEAYLNTLLRDSVTLLCDVRRNPLSRKYGFSKKTLSESCERVGVCYRHLPELGIASECRQELHTQADYDALFAIYERDSLPRQTAALDKIKNWILTENHRVALTCFEAAPCQCHRHCVADALGAQGIPALVPRHL
jgi:hypothetical protein